MPEKRLRFLVEGGRATAAPPIGPALSPLGVNVLQIIEEINGATEEFKGMRVPVDVYVDTETKGFRIEVGTPSVAALIAKEAGLEKGSGAAGREVVGNLSFESLVRIARLKMQGIGARSLKAAAKSIAGTCVSMGVSIEGKAPKEVIAEIDSGVYDQYF